MTAGNGQPVESQSASRQAATHSVGASNIPMKRIAIAIICLTAFAAAQQSGANPSQLPAEKPAPTPTQNAPAKPATPPNGLPQQSSEDPSVRKARGLLDKMVQALGGDAYLNMQDMEFSGRVYGFYRGEPAGTGAPFWDFWKWPDKERVELTKKRDWIIIHNGDKGYEITFRGTAPEEKEPLSDYLRRRHYSLLNILRVWLKQPGIAFFYEGQASAERKPAEQITIMNAQNEAVTLYIDQNTFLPIKKTFTWREPQSRERNDEAEVFDNYRSVQGIMTPFSVTRQKNGMNTNQRFINQVTYNQNLPDSTFEATVTIHPKGTK